MDTQLVWICISSFASVFSVLAFLALTMYVITLVFPAKATTAGVAVPDEAAVYAAITSTYARLYPGKKVSKIKEIKNIDGNK